ncbi:MAG TPA: hypothetical protein VEP89_17505 [Draconibacterium sp.]|nr:hypothetical protein [Draconibacterium sp.]
MKRFTLIGIIILASTLALKAQSSYSLQSSLDFFQSYDRISRNHTGNAVKDNIDGSPYLNEEFIEGTIYTYQKVQFEGIPLRYNIYLDDLEFRTPDNDILALATPEIVEKAVVGEYNLSYIPYMLANRMKRGYFILLKEGDLSLYARPVISFQEAEAAGAYAEAQPAKYVEQPNDYYLRFGMDAAIKIETKKDLENAFSDHQKEIESFIKKNKVKPNKEDKLIALVEYYNSL